MRNTYSISPQDFFPSWKNLSRSATSKIDCDYPSYFGGSYADKNGKLIALIKKDSLFVKSMEFMTSMANEDIDYIGCDYSITELHQTIKT